MYNFQKQTTKDPYNFDMGKTATKPPQNTAQQKAIPTKGKGSKSEKLQSMEPKRFGLRYDPPTIILEYLQASTGKLYHHKMKLLKLRADTPANHALDYLKKKHALYFNNSKLPDNQILDLINKLLKRMASKPKTAAPTTTVRPNTASTVASTQNQKKLTKAIEDYEDSEDDYKVTKKKPILEDDYDYDYEEEEQDEEEMTEEEYQQIYEEMGYNKLDLNKMTPEQVMKHKQIMDQMFNKKIVKPGDANYKYDVQKEFKPQMENAWDDEDDDDYDIV